MRRFDVLKNNAKRLIEISPIGISVYVRGTIICTYDDLELIEAEKDKWVKLFFKDKIVPEIEKADLLSDSRLRANQLKQTIKAAMKAYEYLPDDLEIRHKIAVMESKLAECKKS